MSGGVRGHLYRANVRWIGNRGSGTSDYRAYTRDHLITFPGKPPLPGSSDPAYRGDSGRYNPEELLVASLSACHMLWYLHLCATDGIIVAEYTDDAEGTLETGPDGAGRFTEVVLHPAVTLARGDPTRATALHERAHELCFIANSVNFPVRHEPVVRAAAPSAASGPAAPGD
jgi:organic hydroperoxide reductase OsmC/OhrA